MNKKQFCVNGHDTFICGRDKKHYCNDCQKTHNLTYTIDNREAVQKQRKQHYKENRNSIRQKQKEYYAENKNEIRKNQIQYKLDHLEYFKNYLKQYHKERPYSTQISTAKRRLRIVSWGQEGIENFYNNCSENMVVDHIIPLQGKLVSGLHVLSNLQYLTPCENSIKHNSWDGTLKNNSWRSKLNVSEVFD